STTRYFFYKLVADISCYLLPRLPYALKTHVTLDEYIFQTDKHNVKGLWEWENETVRVIKLPSDFHGKSVGTIVGELAIAFQAVRYTLSGVTFSEATSKGFIGFLNANI